MKRFAKISAIAMSALLAGTSIAAAANYPAPFVSGSTADVAIVYGTGVGVDSSDLVQATNIQTDLESVLPSGAVTAGEGAEGETEDEVDLGGSIVTGKISATMDQNDIPSLLDEKITWDDGDGEDDYDIHEDIVISDMEVITTLDKDDLEEHVAMTNEQGLEYRYVFEDAITTLGDNDDADDLFLELLGKSYEVTSLDADSITVSIADEYALSIGESVVFSGKTFTIDDIFSDSVQINGEIIDLGNTEKIDGVRVNVKTIGYHSNSPETSKTILKIGEDISKTYTDGDEYIGQPDEDYIWAWTIVDANDTDGYIGVKYSVNINDGDDDVDGETIKYVGDSYVFPEDYAIVSLDAITDVAYDDFELYFDEADLYNTSATTSTITVEDGAILIIKGPSESIVVQSDDLDEVETSKIAIYYAFDEDVEGATGSNGTLVLFHMDDGDDYSPSGKWRYTTAWNLTDTGELDSDADLGDIVVEDTTMNLTLNITDGSATLSITDPDDVSIDLNVSGDALDGTSAGTFEDFGTTEDSDDSDMVIGAEDLSSRDDDVMTHYGVIISEPENNLDSDEVALSIPEDKVYAIVSVLGTGGSVSVSGSALGDVVIKDSEAGSVDKNLIVVGGSCINSVAADLLGAGCGAAFTANTGVGTGQFLIQSFASDGKVALVVAGYEAADTVAATQYLTTQTVDTSAGTKYVGTGATSAEMVVA